MERIPREIILDILSRLLIPNLLQCKSVCRAWRCLILDPVLVNKHFERMVENNPTFILQSDLPIQSQLYFGDYDSYAMMTKKLSVPPLLNFHLVGSCNGLLCLRDSDSRRRSYGLSIYNPFTKDYTDLPSLPNIHSFNQNLQGFGFDPITKQYKVVQISYRIPRCGGGVAFHVVGSATNHRIQHRIQHDRVASPPSAIVNEVTVHILTVGSQEWRYLGAMPFHLRWQQAQVLVNGKLHWVSYPNQNNNLIVSFDLATERFQEVPKPDSGGSSSSAGGRFDHVVVLGGCLSIACHEENEGWGIWVMKTYGVKESWSKEFSIGAYLPQTILQQDGHDTFRRVYLGRGMRVLCLLRSGEVLLEYTNRALVVYHPHFGTFRDLHLTFEGTNSKFFKVVVHVSSLNWIDTFVNA